MKGPPQEQKPTSEAIRRSEWTSQDQREAAEDQCELTAVQSALKGGEQLRWMKTAGEADKQVPRVCAHTLDRRGYNRFVILKNEAQTLPVTT